jgi:molybdopterin-biosynthesis enzyme MoeA-like protein
MQSHKQWTAALVVIGDEILSGRTQDRNVAQVATWLNGQGIRLAEVRVVPDDQQRIAAAFGVPVVVHPEARRILEEYYAARGSEVNEARLRMARVPQGAELIANPTSGAPGVRIGNVYILAGVPHIAASMLEALTGTLEGGRPMVSVTLGAYAAESDVADLLREAEGRHSGVAVGSYPFFRDGRYGANFVIRSEDGEAARCCADEIARDLSASGYETVDGGI